MILHLRKQSQLTADQVAAYLGVTIPYYLELEAGSVIPPPALLSKLAEFYTGDFPRLTYLRTIININSGTGSHSNSGYIHSYFNEGNCNLIEHRLAALEKTLQLVLLRTSNIASEDGR